MRTTGDALKITTATMFGMCIAAVVCFAVLLVAWRNCDCDSIPTNATTSLGVDFTSGIIGIVLFAVLAVILGMILLMYQFNPARDALMLKRQLVRGRLARAGFVLNDTKFSAPTSLDLARRHAAEIEAALKKKKARDKADEKDAALIAEAVAKGLVRLDRYGHAIE